GAEPAHALLALLASATPAGRAASQETCLSASLPTASGTRGAVRSTAAYRPARATPCPFFEARGFSMRLRALFLLLAPLAITASAQTTSDSLRTDSLAAVTVTATRLPTETHRVPARVTVLGPAEVAATGAASVADVLEDRSAVFLKRYGPDGLASFSLRGSGASHTLVLLDGHRISDPQLGQLDPTLLPAVLLERAEVVHGPGSAVYGTDAVGGVVALRTPAADRTTLRVQAGSGAFGEQSAGGLLAGPVTGVPLVATFAADTWRSQGDYLYVDSTAFDPETRTNGVTRARENTDVRRGALFGRLALDTESRHDGSVAVLLTDAERGLFDFAAAQEARQSDRAARLWADHTVRLGRARVVSGAAIQWASLRYQNLRIGVDSDGRTRLASLQSRVEITQAVAGGFWTGTVGGQVGTGTADHPNLTEEAHETATAVFAQVVADHGWALATGSLRYDRTAAASADSAGAVQALSPRLGLSLQPTPWRGLRLKASAGRAFRTPTFNDRFWAPGGNPALRPERGWTAEAGLSLDATPGPARLAAEATAFTSRLADQIVWRFGQFADGSYWAPVNVGRVRTTGWEVSASARLGSASTFAEIGGLWTRSLARDRSDPEFPSFDQPLLYVPDDQGKAHVAVGWQAFRIDAGVRHAGRRFSKADGSASLPPYTVADAQISARLAALGGHARLAFRLDNLTDARYSVIPRFPMPPRHIRLSLTVDAF
ncbi:MAG: TonB-dependent receptor, partial [Bacteroidota bacterium]